MRQITTDLNSVNLNPDNDEPTKQSQTNMPLNKLEHANQQSKRERRYSWEKIEIDTAERISVRLIQNAFTVYEKAYATNNKTTPSDAYLRLPNLRLLEFFIQYLEYDEYMQSYFELRSSGKLKKYNSNFNAQFSAQDLSIVRQTTLHPSMSASSIYYSNSSLATLSEATETKSFATGAKKSTRKDTSTLFGSKNSLKTRYIISTAYSY